MQIRKEEKTIHKQHDFVLIQSQGIDSYTTRIKKLRTGFSKIVDTRLIYKNQMHLYLLVRNN